MLPSLLTQLRRIDKIVEDVERLLFERLSESPWHAIQVDESTDAENETAILLVSVCDTSIKMTSRGMYSLLYCCQIK